MISYFTEDIPSLHYEESKYVENLKQRNKQITMSSTVITLCVLLWDWHPAYIFASLCEYINY